MNRFPLPPAAARRGVAGRRRGADDEKASADGDNKPPEGFTALFNGTDLANWQGLVPINVRAKLNPDELAQRTSRRRPTTSSCRTGPSRTASSSTTARATTSRP